MEEDLKQRLERLHTDIIGKLRLKCKNPDILKAMTFELTREQMQDLCEFFDEYLYQ
jgi:hypothetical protein